MIGHQGVHAALGAAAVGTGEDDSAIAVELRGKKQFQHVLIHICASRAAEKGDAFVDFAFDNGVESVLEAAARAAIEEQHGLVVVCENQAEDGFGFALHGSFELRWEGIALYPENA